jgi:hypothetical protein
MGPHLRQSMVWGALKAVEVVHRESFTLATFDPETGELDVSSGSRSLTGVAQQPAGTG